MIAVASNCRITHASDEDAAHDRESPFSGDDAPLTPGERLAGDFENARRLMLRANVPIFTPSIFTGDSPLDKADPAALVEAAEAVLLRQASREVLRTTARLEAGWKSNRRDDCHLRPGPADELVKVLTRERDRAAEFYYDIRKRQAKLKHMDAITRRAEAKASPSGPVAITPAFLR